MKSVEKEEVISIVKLMDKEDKTSFSHYLLNYFNDTQNQTGEIEGFHFETPIIEYLETQRLTELQQRVVDYFDNPNVPDGPRSKCLSQGLDFNEYTKGCCPPNKIYNPETKRCKDKHMDYNKVKQKTKEYCQSRNLDYNEKTKKCCPKGSFYDVKTNRCKKTPETEQSCKTKNLYYNPILQKCCSEDRFYNETLKRCVPKPTL
jgi:hypothetical protein